MSFELSVSRKRYSKKATRCSAMEVLPEPCHALDHQGMSVFIAHDGILVALDGGDDVAHALVGGAGELLLQHVVDDVEVALEDELELTLADAQLALACDLAADPPVGRIEGSRAGLEVVEQRRDGGAPVVNEMRLAVFIEEPVDADVTGVRLVPARAREVDAPEVGRLAQLLQPLLPRQQELSAGHRLLDRLAHDAQSIALFSFGVGAVRDCWCLVVHRCKDISMERAR